MISLNDTISSQLTNKESLSTQPLGVIRVTGNDARKFLQGQITCDINKLAENYSLYGAICSIKGRIVTNFYIAQKDTDILILMSKDLIEKSIQHLKKYAVFFKVELVDASHEFSVFAKVSLPTQTSKPTSLPEQLDTNTDPDNGIRITACEYPIRLDYQIVSNEKSTLKESNIDLTAFAILAARPLIRLENSENILPQWLNMQSTGGISFTKGCYTGQEIVARMQYKGKSPKQLAIFACKKGINLTSKITDHQGKELGYILNSGTVDNTSYIQVIMNIAPQDAEDLFIEGEKLFHLPLPYSINE
ncbi:hypothetical protein OFY17_13765 [Marinomonas sp. C2222]|uniref:GCVT N-terminal domain-containing protein n=1 Tax=Marinomonas sargassi TaxID=2984494 RepID=A0ABT2YWI4_9GAMM|nr:hypothetical protein [Marinomonas sargassi]MCV2403934.1 hypothetical protein [Marinomonas sargassi]